MDWFVDPRRGQWLQERIPSLGMMVPSGMPAYARILHPVDAYRDADDSAQVWSWSDVAVRNGATVDDSSEWWDITGDGMAEEWSDGWAVSEPNHGAIAPALLSSFVPALAAHTERGDDITVAVWEGWGFAGPSEPSTYFSVAVDGDTADQSDPFLAIGEERRKATDPRLIAMDEFEGGAYERAVRGEDVGEFPSPRFDLPDRRYALGSTTLVDLAKAEWPFRSGLGWVQGDLGGTMPQLIWPADETWCISIEVDAPYTVVAGPHELVRALLALPGVEGHAIREPR